MARCDGAKKPQLTLNWLLNHRPDVFDDLVDKTNKFFHRQMRLKQ
jgi:hypothetical protein